MGSGSRPADAGITIGQVFLGKYRVDSILGFGGMGVVAECTHLALNERVAIKMLRQDVLLDNDAVQRFVREAQAAVKLKSEYVARVSDVGTFENGTPYMVMEFLEGHDLGALLKQRGVLPVAWASELILQTAEALAEAHSLGIVHRDVKPTNLFVTWRPDGSALIKVLDFGISKAPMGTDMQLTQTQSLLGTPAYMSPEQMRSARLVDSRSDIWSLGTVLYEILEGRRPFEADSFSEMCVKVAVDPPAPMVNTPPQLQPVIMRCLAKTPEQRYGNMGELARDLVPFVADPHSATVLVERMMRMLRRSHIDWEGGGTGTGRTPIPQSARDLGSAPMRAAPAQQWGAGSDPAGNAWHGKSDPSIQPYPGHPSQPMHQDGSQPFAHVTETVSVSGKMRWPLVLTIIGVLTMTGIGIGLYASSLGNDSKPAADQLAAPPTAMETKPVEPKGVVADPKPDVKAVGGVGANTDGRADAKAIDPNAIDGKPEVKIDGKPEVKIDGKIKIDGKTEVKIDGKTKIDGKNDEPKAIGDAKRPVQPKHPLPPTKTNKTTGAIKTTTGTGVKKTDDKTGKPSVPDPISVPAEVPKCDPFTSMHGCPK